jgi:uncharacterized membrane protein
MVTLVWIIYGLHGFSALNGFLTPALVVTVFLTGWPSILALIISYVKRGDAAGTYLASHFSWLIRTFWFTLLWVVIGLLMLPTIFLTIPGIILLIAVGVWVLYRLIRGALALLEEKQVGPDESGLMS